MPDETPAPAPAAPAPKPTAVVTDVQAREALAAVLEVLEGADTARVLKLAGKIALGKMVVAEIASGRVTLQTWPAGQV